MAAMVMAATAMVAVEITMQRIICPERDDWRTTAENAGFDFHTIDDERYWDERAYYAFTLEEIEHGSRPGGRARSPPARPSPTAR